MLPSEARRTSLPLVASSEEPVDGTPGSGRGNDCSSNSRIARSSSDSRMISTGDPRTARRPAALSGSGPPHAGVAQAGAVDNRSARSQRGIEARR